MQSGYHDKPPFEVTPQIKRYLDDILYISDEWKQKNPFYLIESRLPSEMNTPKRRQNNGYFWRYMEKELGAIKTFNMATLNVMPTIDALKNAYKGHGVVAIARTYEDKQTPFKTFHATPERLDVIFKKIVELGRPSMSVPKKEHYIILKILNAEPINDLRNEIEALSQTEKEKAVGSSTRLICMDGEGDFTIGKDKDAILFKSKKAGYYKVFVAIYKITGGITGKASYKKISEHIRLYLGGGKELSMKQIQNHINNSVKRHYLPKETPDGKEILSADSEGKAIIFYNPVVG